MVKLPATIRNNGACSELLLIISLSRSFRTKRGTQQLESVQKTTRAATIWEILRFECDSIAAYTGGCSSSGPLEQRPHANSHRFRTLQAVPNIEEENLSQMPYSQLRWSQAFSS